jgi:hypothetical protein
MPLIPAPVISGVNCVGDEWRNVLVGTAYQRTAPCLGKLRISWNFGGSSGGYSTRGLFVKPRSTWVGYCIYNNYGSDPYVQSVSGSSCLGSINSLGFVIDVWQMFRDSLWSSSLAIDVAVVYTPGGSYAPVVGITDDASGLGVARCRVNDTISVPANPVETSCGGGSPTKTHTVTVYDDGTMAAA